MVAERHFAGPRINRAGVRAPLCEECLGADVAEVACGVLDAVGAVLEALGGLPMAPRALAHGPGRLNDGLA